jgi:REP element-mobilizing transposase RayT
MSFKSHILRMPDVVLHVYNRGVDRQLLFFRPSDYEYFLLLVRESLARAQVSLLAYCLMPNHFHLALHQREAHAVSPFIQWFTRGYVRNVNRRRARTGHLFEGRFQARLVENAGDLLRLTRYIHLNPATAGLVRDPLQWERSSLREYAGLAATSLITPDRVLHAAGGRDAYLTFLREEPPASAPEVETAGVASVIYQ